MRRSEWKSVGVSSCRSRGPSCLVLVINSGVGISNEGDSGGERNRRRWWSRKWSDHGQDTRSTDVGRAPANTQPLERVIHCRKYDLSRPVANTLFHVHGNRVPVGWNRPCQYSPRKTADFVNGTHFWIVSNRVLCTLKNINYLLCDGSSR